MAYPSPVHTDFLEWFKAISTALIALAIGAITVFIAWKQKEIANAKLKLDLFDKRYRIFEQVFQITCDTARYGPGHEKFKQIEFGDTPYERFKPEAHFLFGPGIYLYIDELTRKWRHYRVYDLKRETTDELEDLTELTVYFAMAAQVGVQEQFEPYLEFEKWK